MLDADDTVVLAQKTLTNETSREILGRLGLH